MTDKEICTVGNCENFKSPGDLLFCFKCRYSWRSICKINGIEEIQIDENDLNLFLGAFQGKISLKEFYEKQGWGIGEEVTED